MTHGSSRLALLLLLPVASVAKDRSSADVDRVIRRELAACVDQAVKDAEHTQGLVVPGLKSCYDSAAGRWELATAPIKERLLAARGSDCAEAVEALLQEWQEYSTRLTELPAVQDMPINTDDELRLVLGRHLYDLVVAMTANVQCPK